MRVIQQFKAEYKTHFKVALAFTLAMLGAPGLCATPGAAQSIVPPSDKDVVVVLNSRDATVTLLDQNTYQILTTYPVGKEPHHLMATPDNKALIVAAATGDELMFLDPQTGLKQSVLKDIADPYQIGFSPDQKWFVANGLRLNRVDIYRFEHGKLSIAARVPLPSMPSHMAFTRDSKIAFITLQGSDEVAAIDLATQKVLWKLPVGSEPAGAYMTPGDKYLLIGVMGKDYVAVVDWRNQKIVKKIKTADGAHNFRGAGDGKHVYVSNRVGGMIDLVDMDSLSVVSSIAVPGGPDCMEITADGKRMWVTQRWIKRVSVIDLPTMKIIKTISVGRSPHGIYFKNRAPDA